MLYILQTNSLTTLNWQLSVLATLCTPLLFHIAEKKKPFFFFFFFHTVCQKKLTECEKFKQTAGVLSVSSFWLLSATFCSLFWPHALGRLSATVIISITYKKCWQRSTGALPAARQQRDSGDITVDLLKNFSGTKANMPPTSFPYDCWLQAQLRMLFLLECFFNEYVNVSQLLTVIILQ